MTRWRRDDPVRCAGTSIRIWSASPSLRKNASPLSKNTIPSTPFNRLNLARDGVLDELQ